MYQRIVLLATAGVLALGVAACGKSTAKPANAGTVDNGPAASAATTTSPSPDASKLPLPDKDSCRKATDLVQPVGVRIAYYRQTAQTDPTVHIYAIRTIPDFLTSAAQVNAAILDARVKAIVEQYRADLEQLKAKLENSHDDRATILAAFDDANAKLDKGTQNLAAICTETLANDGGRAATCDKVREIQKRLSGHLAELDAAGTDLAKLKTAVPYFQTNLRTVVTDLQTAADQSIDSSIKSAISRLKADLTTLKNNIDFARMDGAKIRTAVATAPHGGADDINRLCGS